MLMQKNLFAIYILQHSMRFMEITVATSSKQIYRKLAAKTMIIIAS
jgi:hypothetical protein